MASGAAFLGFCLTWLLQEVPLRETPRVEDIGGSFAMPRDATSLVELETIVSRAARPEHRWDMIERIARRLQLDLAPDEIWFLVKTARRATWHSYADPHNRPQAPHNSEKQRRG